MAIVSKPCLVVGVPKEIKNNENRVALTPGGAGMLQMSGHRVLVEAGAGIGSGFSDEDYKQEGATIIACAEDVWAQSDMIMKVKEPCLPNMDISKKVRFYLLICT